MAEATTTTFDIDRLPGKSVFNGSFDGHEIWIVPAVGGSLIPSRNSYWENL